MQAWQRLAGTPAQAYPRPAGLDRTVQLPSGTVVRLRPIRPDDAAGELALFDRLSPHSRYLRFLAPIKVVPPTVLERLTRPDFEREMALVAVIQTEKGERLIGVARYVILDDGRTCEFAIVIDDEWQGRGVARPLMAALMEAARDHHHLDAMQGQTLAENYRMLRLSRALGFENATDPGDSTMIMLRRRL